MNAGGDYTGTPSLNNKSPYGFALVAVANVELLEEAFTQIHQAGGLPARDELRGYDLPVKVQAEVLKVLCEQDARIAVLMLNKTHLLATPQAALPPAAIMHHQFGLVVLERVLRQYALSNLKCDEELRGQAQKEFVTAVQRLSRVLWPDTRLKVKLLPSHTSVLVQAADVVAYNFSRFVRNALEDELQQCLLALQRQEHNIFLETREWNDEVMGRVKNDLRP